MSNHDPMDDLRRQCEESMRRGMMMLRPKVEYVAPRLTLVQLDFSGVTSFVDVDGVAYAGPEASHRAWAKCAADEVEQVREALSQRVPVVSLPPGVKVEFIAVPVLPIADEVAPPVVMRYAPETS